ncbi:MAG TPA: hypothetical protein ENN67_00105 [Firmicutes bacterium]|nr:hypothetical protein [Bacillota bacterium]
MSALTVLVLGVVLTIYSSPLFSDRGVLSICIPAIWITVIAVNWGLVRNGVQFLAWRKGKHTGIVQEPGLPAPGLFDDILNLAILIVFVAFGIIVLVAGDLGFSDRYAITQIPVAILSMAFGLTSGASARLHFWLRRAGLVDIEHTAPSSDDKQD